MSVVQKIVPPGDGRGIALAAATSGPLLETGTVGELWMVTKPLLVGPKGWKGVR